MKNLIPLAWRTKHHRNLLLGQRNREGSSDFSTFSKKVWIKCNLPLKQRVLASTGAVGIFHFSLHFDSAFLHPQSKQLCLVWLVTKHETSLKILSIKKRTSFLTRFFNFLAALLKTFIHFMPHYGICSITQSTSFVPQEMIWNFTVRTEHFLSVNETPYFGYLEWLFFFHRQVLKGYLNQYFQHKNRKVNYLRKSTGYQSTHLSQFHTKQYI